MKPPITRVILLAVALLLCSSAYAEPDPKSITEHPQFPYLKKALTNFVERRASGKTATLIIPKYREGDEGIIIYWVEERALFDFALGFNNPDAVKHANLLNRRFWYLTDEFFYPADSKNPGHHSSTFMNTWESAKEMVFTAVKDGYILTIESNDKPEQSP